MTHQLVATKLAFVNAFIIFRLASVCSLSLFQMSRLSNFGLSQPFVVNNLSSCIDLCNGTTNGNGNVSGVSYSKYSGQCVASYCGNLKITQDGLWDTYVCVDFMNTCHMPRPIFEWMMTDNCGFSNSGTLNYGLKMNLVNYSANSMSQWVPNYMQSPSTIFGRAVAYPAPSNVFAYANTSFFTLDLRVQSLTIFSYVWFDQILTLLAGGFYQVTATAVVTGNGPSLWPYYTSYSKLYVAGAFGGGNCTFQWPNTPTLRVWAYYALVFNSASRTYTVYLNNTVLTSCTSNVYTSASTSTSFLTFTRSTINAAGSTYCVKVFLSALSQQDIENVANSCLVGQLEFV